MSLTTMVVYSETAATNYPNAVTERRVATRGVALRSVQLIRFDAITGHDLWTYYIRKHVQRESKYQPPRANFASKHKMQVKNMHVCMCGILNASASALLQLLHITYICMCVCICSYYAEFYDFCRQKGDVSHLQQQYH